MRVKGVSMFELFAHRCECGELNVHGFWHQMETKVIGKRAFAKMPCRKCKAYRVRSFPLTSGRAVRPRIFPWMGWFTWLILRLPAGWSRNWMIALTLWLERRVAL